MAITVTKSPFWFGLWNGEWNHPEITLLQNEDEFLRARTKDGREWYCFVAPGTNRVAKLVFSPRNGEMDDNIEWPLA